MYIVLWVLLSICLLIGSLFFLERSKNRLLWKELGNTLEENVRLTFELAEWKRKVGQITSIQYIPEEARKCFSAVWKARHGKTDTDSL